MGKYTKIQIPENVKDNIDVIIKQNPLINQRFDAIKVLLTLIANGYYDETLQNEKDKEVTINAPSELNKEAKIHLRKLGYTRMSDALNVVIQSQIENDVTDLEMIYHQISMNEVEGDKND